MAIGNNRGFDDEPSNLTRTTTRDLVQKFVDLVTAQDVAELHGKISKYNRLFAEMMDVANELKRRDGDQRRALLDLFDHPNLHVRIQAAKLTLAIAPAAARAVLQIIADSKRLPYSADAGMCLWNLDRGVFKPT